MTQEEKAKRYDDALEIARKINSGEGVPAPPDWTVYEVIFPELKESEDERVRKAILTGLIDCRDAPDLGWNDFGGIVIDDCIAWLEKQGEKPKKVSIWKHWKDGIAGGAADEQVFLQKIGRNYCISSCLGCECDYIELSELDKLMREEKQGKPKWSEEDESKVKDVIYFLDTAKVHYASTVELDACIDWLKSLKQKLGGEE